MPIIYQHRIYRSDLQLNPSVFYVFGDNARRAGFGGQAAEMRGEPNAIGVATKWAPSMAESSFFSDHHRFTEAIKIVAGDLGKVEDKLIDGNIVIFPSDGLGTGLSQLPQRAPFVLKYIEETIKVLDRHYQ